MVCSRSYSASSFLLQLTTRSSLNIYPLFQNQVAGYAVGGGHVLHMVCDLTIAAENAIFGQTGPKVLNVLGTQVFIKKDLRHIILGMISKSPYTIGIKFIHHTFYF